MYVESAMDLGAISVDDGGNLGDEIEENSISLEELLWEVDELTQTVTLALTLALALARTLTYGRWTSCETIRPPPPLPAQVPSAKLTLSLTLTLS